MKLMNLFDRKGESSEASFEDTKLKETTNQLPSSPIQDEDGNLTFSLEGKTYSLNVNSEEERERVKAEVNTNSLAKYDWFKEETGEKHWVLYNTEMYEMIRDDIFYLHYKKDSNLAPVIPINASSCYKMFYEIIEHNSSNFDTSKVTDMSYMFSYCSRLISLDLSSFDTSNVTDMSYMFEDCSGITLLDLSNFNTSKVTIMGDMFYNCESLTQLDLSSFNTGKVTDTIEMFAYCIKLTTINVSNQWNTDSVKFSIKMFKKCYSLPNFNEEKTNVEMAKPVEQGGYLTLKQ